MIKKSHSSAFSPGDHAGSSRLTLGVLTVIAALLTGAIPAWAQTGTTVEASKHNLSASGPGPVKTSARVESCQFCHTPHAASPAAPLWNRTDPGSYYQTYESSTLKATVGQPTGASRLCLSCHDGTIALSQTYNSRNAPGGGAIFISASDRGYLGTDLSDDHPISFPYDSGLAARKGQLHDPSTVSLTLPLEHGRNMQCTTCHDPHDDQFGKFLRMDNRGSQMCMSCHDLTDWPASAHANSGSSLNGARRDRWSNLRVSTVRDAGCESCHSPHNAGGRHRLLRFEAEESNCLNCHDGTVARTDLARDLLKLSTHPVDRTTGVHDPTEDPNSMRAHVECADCHNPHRTSATGTARAPFIKPSMKGASGMNSTGTLIAAAEYEYEVCYKCHSRRNFATPVVDRVLGTNNIADEFSTSCASFHPIETTGRNNFVPSLVNTLTPATILYCTSCHGSDDPNGAKGPHGSANKPLLIATYTTGDSVLESPQVYDLCYTCHNRSSILADESFKTHKLHIVDQKTPCSVCHDPHGVRENAKLINFDRNVVRPSETTGRGPTFTNGSTRHGSCALSCHGKEHNDLAY
jgi:predicted CXXCH cytochrome family protein